MLAVLKTVVDKNNMNDPSIEPGFFSVFFFFFFFGGLTALFRLGLLFVEISRDRTWLDTPHAIGLLWTSD